MTSPAAQNLEAIQKAMVRHNGNCPSPLVEIRMNPFEVERLGFEEFRGVPIAGDDSLPTGRFRLVCSGQHDGDPVEAVGVGASEGAAVTTSSSPSAEDGGGGGNNEGRPLAGSCRKEGPWVG